MTASMRAWAMRANLSEAERNRSASSTITQAGGTGRDVGGEGQE
jgi:hypothetical protein